MFDGGVTGSIRFFSNIDWQYFRTSTHLSIVQTFKVILKPRLLRLIARYDEVKFTEF